MNWLYNIFLIEPNHPFGNILNIHPIGLITIITFIVILLLLFISINHKYKFKLFYHYYTTLQTLIITLYFIFTLFILWTPFHVLFTMFDLNNLFTLSSKFNYFNALELKQTLFEQMTFIRHNSTLFNYNYNQILWFLVITVLTFIYYLYLQFSSKIKFSNEFFIFLILIYLGTLLVGSANNLLFLELAFSIISFSTIGLINCYKTNLSITKQYKQESLLQFYINSVFSSILFIAAIAGFYSLFSTINITWLKGFMINETTLNVFVQTFEQKIIFYFSIITIILSFTYKINVFPFSRWIISFYESIPTLILSYITTIPKLGYTLFVVFNLMQLINPIQDLTNIIFFVLSGITLLYSFIGLKESQPKRILAYSSVFHGSLFLIFITTTPTALLYYSFFYHITMICIWLGILILESLYLIQIPTTTNYTLKDINITIWGSLLQKNKYLTGSLTILFFILSGLPPFIYFIIKVIGFTAILSTSTSLVIILLILISSFVSLFFYLKLIIPIWTEKLNIKALSSKPKLINSNLINLYTISFGICLISHIFTFKLVIQLLQFSANIY